MTTFSASDIEGLSPAMKVGLLATVNDEGQPHLTLLSSLRAAAPTQLTFGQFTEGLSKEFIRRNPRAGFLVMSLQKQLWRGTGTFTHTAKGGPEYDAYNNEPLFRYNSYFGIHTVYFLDLREHEGRTDLPMGGIVSASLMTAAARVLSRGPKREGPAINTWTRGLLSAMGNLKFASFVAADGYPRIIPILQAQAASPDRVIFSPSIYGRDIDEIPAGAALAIFGMTLKMEDVLLRGRYAGIQRCGGIRCGVAEIDWVYNSMPPVPGQIYPRPELETVRDF
jgi:Pyridoxamine 5'-phosphate oxidase